MTVLYKIFYKLADGCMASCVCHSQPLNFSTDNNIEAVQSQQAARLYRLDNNCPPLCV